MRDRELKSASISRWRYLELKAFCRQYDEKKHAAAQLLCVSSPRMDGMPGGKGGTGNPVYAAVLRREKLLAVCEKIEQAAIAADPVGYRAIIKNVAQGIRYEETGYYGCRSDFFRARRRFFAALDESMEPKGQRMSV